MFYRWDFSEKPFDTLDVPKKYLRKIYLVRTQSFPKN